MSYNQVAGIRHFRYFLCLACPPSAKQSGTYTQCAARVCTFCTHHDTVNIMYSRTISTTLILTACDDDTTSCRTIVTDIVTNIVVAMNAVVCISNSILMPPILALKKTELR